MPSAHLKAIRAKVQRHRDGLREQGLRPIQIWVPDVDARSFRAAAHRQLDLMLDGLRARHAVDAGPGLSIEEVLDRRTG